MRCFSCGKRLSEHPEVCPRCRTRISGPMIRRHFAITFVYALVATCAMALLIFMILLWQDAHMASGI